ncbi:MAG: peroxiredoxin family protein [Armatimonadota bacterium]
MKRQKERMLQQGEFPPDFGFGNEQAFYKLSELAGRRRVLILLCPDGLSPDCAEAIRAVAADCRKFGEREVIPVAISSASERDLTEFAEREAIPIVLISDEPGLTIKAYGAQALTTYLIGKDGTVHASWTGHPNTREILEKVDALEDRLEAA